MNCNGYTTFYRIYAPSLHPQLFCDNQSARHRNRNHFLLFFQCSSLFHSLEKFSDINYDLCNFICQFFKLDGRGPLNLHHLFASHIYREYVSSLELPACHLFFGFPLFIFDFFVSNKSSSKHLNVISEAQNQCVKPKQCNTHWSRNRKTNR